MNNKNNLESIAIGSVLIYLSFALVFAINRMLWHPPAIWVSQSLLLFFILPVFIYDGVIYQSESFLKYITIPLIVVDILVLAIFKDRGNLPYVLYVFVVVSLLYTFFLLKLYKQYKLFYLGIGRWKIWLPVLAVVFVVIIIGTAYFSSKRAYIRVYPLYKYYIRSNGEIFFYELSFLIFMFSWEFLFRGFLIPILRKKTGLFLAIAISTIIFSLAHYGKPETEIYSSIFGGVLLGYLTVYFESVYPAVLSHFFLSFTMNMFVMLRVGKIHAPAVIMNLLKSLH
ncbi:MAG: CPBP family intramembrane metalloprotease [Proteobacteria bacterium]|nr:CPBP family intramembrane metalloprotease [Pseudomonadota bacterium]